MRKLTFLIFLLVLLGSTHPIRVEVADEGLTEESLANNINSLGCHLLNGLYKDTAIDENILVSPVNAYAALALLHLGAGSKTREELAAVIQLTGNQNSTEVHQRLNALLSKLPSKSDDPGLHETILANAIFLQNGFPVRDSYSELAKKYYDSVAKNVDFSGKPQEATNEVNNWISTVTKGRTDKLYDDPISSNTLAILTSALYFKAQWQKPFSVENTKNETFSTGGSAEIQTPMMATQRSLFYVSDHVLHYHSVTLPYSGHEYEMIIYLQHEGHSEEGSLAHLYHQLAEKNFTTNIGSRALVDLKLPKMKFSWKNSLVKALKLDPIFEQPDLSEMTSQNNLKISNMIHLAELEVDEKGTVATTAYALNMSLVSAFNIAKEEPIKFHVDRPFLVIVRHVLSKTNLFAGIVRKPIPE